MIVVKTASNSGPWLDDDVVFAWCERHAELAVLRVVQVAHAVDRAVGAEVGIGRLVPPAELDLAGDRSAIDIGDLGRHVAGHRKLNKLLGGFRGVERDRLFAATLGATSA